MNPPKRLTTLPAPDDPLYTHDEAADYLGVAPNTLAAYRQSGNPEIPYVQYGGRKSRVFYKRSVLDAFIARSTRLNTSASAVTRSASR